MIKHLEFIGDPLIKKFKHKDLKMICDNKNYHSPEESETDIESRKSIIVIKDLKWSSSTVSISFFNILLFLIYTNCF